MAKPSTEEEKQLEAAVLISARSVQAGGNQCGASVTLLWK